MRSVCVLFHRYAGLAMAGFLAIAGLTGAVLAFFEEIDGLLNPEFYSAPATGTPLDLLALIERARADHPTMDILYAETEGEAGHPALIIGQPKLNPLNGQPFTLSDSWLYLDPVSGETLASRTWGECCFEAENVIPILYEFHHDLTLPGSWGLYLMGIIAILWVIDCLVAPILTLPTGRPFWTKWKIAWTLKWGAGSHRMTLDVHRASGLWLWLLFLPVAVSSVAMNLPEEVFRPVVSWFSPIKQHVYYQRQDMPAAERGTPSLDFPAMIARAQQDAAQEKATFPALDAPPSALYFSRELNYFAVGFGDEHGQPLGAAWLYYDGTSGTLLDRTIPGHGTAGEIFNQLQEPIHGGRIAGLPGRIIIAVLGVALAVLSITGVLIWWKKHRARRSQAQRAAQREMQRETQREAAQPLP